MTTAVALRLALLVAIAAIGYLLYRQALKAMDSRMSPEDRRRIAVIEESSLHRHPRLHLWFPWKK